MPKRQAANPAEYAKKRAGIQRRQTENSKAARDIAASQPDCVDAELRDAVKADLRLFLETVFPKRFHLAWSADHLELIADVQRAVIDGDQLARALPRGTGKTNILVCSVIWGIVTGIHECIVLIGATAGAAKELLEQIQTELETNDVLYGLFPELLHAVRCLEGVHQKRLLFNGEPIFQSYCKDRIVLPGIPGVAGASCVVKVAGLLGRIRGMNFTRPSDGRNVRPTLVLCDDPQTDESAAHDKQNDKRESIICGTVPGLAGPGVKTSVLLACTIKCPGDLSARLLDRERHPEWRGKRTALLRSIPTNVDLWNQYAEIYRDTMRRDEPIDRATDFYVANREEMDKGGEASWPARFNPGEISAIQYGMGLKIINPSAFASEYQNCPLVLIEHTKQTDADKIVLRVNGRARGVVPLEVETLAVGVDVQKNYLVYSVVGFADNATPYIVDYGTFPKQNTNYFDRRSATQTIENAFPEGEFDGRLYKALEGLTAQLFGSEWKREDGQAMALKKVAIDIRFKGNLIKKFCKASGHKDVLLPAQGIYIAPGAMGINEREAKPGEISKNEFRLPPLRMGQIARTVSFDSAEYISKVHDALNCPMGQTGALTLFKAEPHLHRNFADQLCSEYSTLVEVKGRKKRVWALKPNGGDNDFLDSTKLAFVAAYVSGVEPNYLATPVKKSIPGQKRPPKFASI